MGHSFGVLKVTSFGVLCVVMTILSHQPSAGVRQSLRKCPAGRGDWVSLTHISVEPVGTLLQSCRHTIIRCLVGPFWWWGRHPQLARPGCDRHWSGETFICGFGLVHFLGLGAVLSAVLWYSEVWSFPKMQTQIRECRVREQSDWRCVMLRTASLPAQAQLTGSSLGTQLSSLKIHSLPAGPLVHHPYGLPAEWPLRSFAQAPESSGEVTLGSSWHLSIFIRCYSILTEALEERGKEKW